jgi:hypothetical protein
LDLSINMPKRKCFLMDQNLSETAWTWNRSPLKRRRANGHP